MSQFVFPPLTANLDSEASNGGSLPGSVLVVAGYDGANVRAIKTDSTGEVAVDISSIGTVTVTGTVAVSAIAGALPAGTNEIGKLAAGTASIGTVVLGAGTAEIGKLAAGTASIGTVVLGAGTAEIGKLAAGTAAIGKLVANDGVDIGDVDVTSIVPGVGATNLGKAIQSAQGTTDTGVPALVVRNDTLADLSGADGDYAPLQVNATGALYVEVKTSGLPSGAATEAKQDVIETTLNSIEGDTSSLAGAVSGTEMQVDVVASLPGGTNSIGTVILGAGTAEIGKLAAGTASIGTVILGTGSAQIGKLAANSGVDIGDVDVTSLPALPAGTNTIGKVDVNAIAPVDFLDSGVVDSSTANIISTGTTGTVVVSTLAAACTEIEIQEDIGEFMSLRVGGAVKAYLPLGGGRVKVTLAATDAVALFSETGSAISSGKIAINFLG